MEPREDVVGIRLEQRIIANKIIVARDVEELVSKFSCFFNATLLEYQMKPDVVRDAVEHSVLVKTVWAKVGVGGDEDFFGLRLA